MDAAVEKAEIQITKSVTVKEKPARKPLDTTNLPVEEIHLYPDGTTDENGTLSSEYVEIGTEETSRLEYIPSKVYIVKTIRHKVISKSDITNEYPEGRKILTPALPLVPESKCIAGSSVLTDIIVNKFVYHLPFYRIIQQYKEGGFTVSDSTIGGWYEAAVEKLKLIYDKLRQQILSSEYVQIDESVIPVIDNEKHMARKGYQWCVRDGITGDVMFYYDRGSRGKHVAMELLGNYKGMVQSDGYEAYDQFEGKDDITMYGCWAHARRKFADALEENKTVASQAIYYISQLYKVENEVDDAKFTADQRKEKRLKESYPVLQVFEKWLIDTYPKVAPKSKCGTAIAYTYSLLPRLSRYVNDGRVKIDNNLIENAIGHLLSYCKRFFERQFTTAQTKQNSLALRLDALIDNYLSSGSAAQLGQPTVAWCATQFRLSANYFGEIVRREIHITAQEFIQQKIIAAAIRLLEDTTMTVNAISEELGFSYPNLFSRMFKHYTGHTPFDWRHKSPH